jgi:NaMN:DMB phosphoribosyltransferase
MVSTVRPRPNYYEVLGLTATATIEEIRHAFASRTSLFQRPLADTAELAVAFETLRDPARYWYVTSPALKCRKW